MRVRRFVCRVRWCRRKVFAERLPELAAPFARRTARLTVACLIVIAFFVVAKFVPASLVSKPSSRPRHTWSGSVGSTCRNWLYQACTPGMYPGSVSAESDAASL